MKNRKNFKKNLSWIFVGNLIHAIISFIINVVAARILSTNEYGIINYVASWISFFNAFATLGITSVINKYFTEKDKETAEYLNTSIILRFISSILSSIILMILLLFINYNEKEILIISAIESLTFVFSIFDVYVYWFRYKKEAKVVAILRLVSLIFASIIKIFALILFKNVYIYVFGIVTETLSFSLLLLHQYNKNRKNKITFNKIKARNILKVSKPFIIANIMVTIYAYTDKIMLQKMMSNSDVATYSISVTVAGIISTLASALIEGYRVEIMDAKKRNKELYKRRLKQIYCILFWLSIIYGLFITLFGKYILLILYGEKYISALPSLSIIVWYTSFSYFGAINNIYMLAEEKEKWVKINTFIGTLCNITLNLILIPLIGIIGAALASLITQIIANFIILFFIKDLQPLAKEIINGIMFRNCFSKTKKYIIQ